MILIVENIPINKSPKQNDDNSYPIIRSINEQISKKRHHNNHICVQIKKHKIDNTVSNFSTTFIFFEICKNQIVFINLVLDEEIKRSKERNDWY